NGLGGQFNQINANTLRVAWSEPTVSPVTLPDGTVIYKMRFVVLGNAGTSSDVVFLTPPASIVEISCCEPLQELNAYNLTNSEVNVDCSGGGPIVVTDTLITHILCNGQSTGAINITVSGGTGSYTYEWSNSATTQDIS